MDIHNRVNEEINRLVDILRRDQSPDGAWRYCFEGPIMSDAYMIIILRSLNIHDEQLIEQLVRRILSKQANNGAWKIYYDEEDGNLSSTIEAYYALLFSGKIDQSDERMQAAKQFIIDKGGLGEADLLTKVILACTGNYPWPKYIPIPIEMVLLPSSSPIDFFDIVGYTRAHLVPILITANLKFSLKTAQTPDLSELLFTRGETSETLERSFFTVLEQIKQWINQFPYSPSRIRHSAIERAEQYMLERIEPNGTLYSYASTTFLMIFALLARGYRKTHPIILHAVNGLKSFISETKDGFHLQNSPATVWNTALLSDALQNAGVSPYDPMIRKAGNYLLSRQHTKYGDWAVHNPNVRPGGWGFSDINTIVPDVDDTSAALRAIRRLALHDKVYRMAWNRGLRWLISMQNRDGGWPAFEKNTNKKILTLLPLKGTEDIIIDPSSSDLTGRAIEFLADDVGLKTDNKIVRKAVQWFKRNQNVDGSWQGRWGVNYIYGTWAAVTGLTSVGVNKDDPSLLKAKKWLIEIQNDDGGWGESCQSDILGEYMPLMKSTPSQTAWAVDALISLSDQDSYNIQEGILLLTDQQRFEHWAKSYPTGAGLPGSFYIHYHSYRYIWPLYALGNYRKKFHH